MAQTTYTPVGGDWIEIAEGPAVVTMTAFGTRAWYALREDGGDPPQSFGHALNTREDKSIQIEAGTRLYVTGRRGTVAWSKDDT